MRGELVNSILGGGFKCFLFSSLLVKDSILTHIFKGLKPPASIPTPPKPKQVPSYPLSLQEADSLVWLGVQRKYLSNRTPTWEKISWAQQDYPRDPDSPSDNGNGTLRWYGNMI